MSIHSGKSKIYDNNDSKDILGLQVEELYEKITKTIIEPNKKYLIFNLISQFSDRKEVNMPRIKYCLAAK
jgi:hypothetical protein